MHLTSFTALLVFLFTSSAFADCPRGSLDKRFCDRNGDLVADTPTDPSEWVDPNPLIFAYTPVEDPAVYKEAWSDFLVHMEKVTGKDVLFFPVQSMLRKLKQCVQADSTLLASTQALILSPSIVQALSPLLSWPV